MGAAVLHPAHGPGIVARVLDGGRKALVRFERRPTVPLVVPRDQLQVRAPPRLRAPAVELPTPPPARSAPADAQTLEALRLGVVPVRGLDALTVGRHEEQARIRGLLEAGRGMLVVSGGYGTGKTHLIELAENLGQDRGFLVARATFDPATPLGLA